MKKFIRIIFCVLLTGAVAGFIYWQFIKKRVIKNSIQSTVEKKTDSLYFIRYDSSHINEITGSASFYNVVLQPDPAQKKILESTDSLPNALYNITVAEVSAIGVNIPGLLEKRNLAAASIQLIRPVIQIMNTGADKPKPFTYKDTLQLYEKILGNFKSIKAGTINVVNGTLLMTDKSGKALTAVENINISLHNFLVDSTRNYKNIISYFIKDVNVSVANIQLPETGKTKRITISNIVYDAPARKLQIGGLKQYTAGNVQPETDIKNIVISQLNTDAFILDQQLKAGLLTCAGGVLTIYKKKTSGSGKKEKTIEFSSDVIDGAQIEALQTGSTTIIIKDANEPAAAPFIINDVKCTATNISPVTNGSTISSLVNNAVWEITAGGFSFITGDKIYQFSATGLQLNSNGAINVKELLLKPRISEATFSKISTFQKDFYNMAFTNIHAAGTDFKKLLSTGQFETDTVTMQPLIKVFDDRMLPMDSTIIIRKYPHQSLTALPFHFGIKRINVKNGTVYYKEKGKETALPGTVYFSSINGTLENVTNIPEKIQENSKLHVKATGLLLGKGHVTTEWILPLRNSDTVFTVTGKMGQLNGTVLNPLIEPLGKVLIKSGVVKSIEFSMNGTDYKGTGTSMFLYNDLKVEALKLKEEEFKKKTLATFLANTLIINDNPKNDKIRTGKIDFNRDLQKSFFNLVWKSMFNGVKHTVL